MKHIALAVAAIVVLAAVVNFLRPVPPASLQARLPRSWTLPGTAPAMPWPSHGEATVSIQGVGTLGSSGPDRPLPIGSLAKIMVAFLVLKHHPLGANQNGPVITVTPADVAAYQADLGPTQQSLVPVVLGERLSERQLLEALLIPSGNNIATVLARWVSGTQRRFIALMNRTARSLGMRHTHYADTSGFSAATVSTARDQVRLARLALAQPAFRAISRMPQVRLPIVGLTYNFDYGLGHDGIFGVKTGSTVIAGGSYVFAAHRRVGGQRVTVLGAVLGQPGVHPLQNAIAAGERLVVAAAGAVHRELLVPRGTVAAVVRGPWTPPVPVTTPRAVTALGWAGLTVRARVVPSPLTPRIAAGQVVGRLRVTVGRQRFAVALRAKRSLPRPSLLWRLTRL